MNVEEAYEAWNAAYDAAPRSYSAHVMADIEFLIAVGVFKREEVNITDIAHVPLNAHKVHQMVKAELKKAGIHHLNSARGMWQG